MSTQLKGALVAALLFLLGAVAGVAVDRVWLGRWPSEAQAAPLTVDAMADALDLDASQNGRVRRVLDSLRADLARAAQAGPDSLRDAAQRGRRRLEEALPPDRRPHFEAWMDEHHARMMQMMGSGMMHSSDSGGMMRVPGETPPDSGTMMGPGVIRTDTGRGGMMRPGMMGPDSGSDGMMGSGMMRPDSGGGRRRR